MPLEPLTGRFRLSSRQSLRWRLPMLVVGLVIFVLVTFLWAAYDQMERTLVETGLARAHAASEQLVNLLAPSFQPRAADLKRVAAQPGLRAFLTDQNDDTRRAADAGLRSLVTTGRQVVELWNSSGVRLMAVSVPAAADSEFPPPAAPADGVRLTQGGPGLIVSEAAERITADAPMTVEPAIGYLVVRRPLTSSSPEVLNRLVGGGARVSLGSRNGSWTDLVAIVPPPPAVLSRPGTAEYRSPNGDARVGALGEIPSTPWLVWVDFPRAVFLAPADAFLYRTGFIALGLVVLAGLVTRLGMGRITNPLAALTEASEAIAAGHYDRRVTTIRSDEIGRLGAAFNSMVSQVQDAHQHLLLAVQSRSRFEDLLESTTDFVTIGQRIGPPLYINRAAREALGIGPTEQVPSLVAFRPAGFEEFFENTILPSALRTGMWRGPTEYVSRSGRMMPVSQVSIVHRTARGALDYISTISRDISDEKRAAREREELEDQLRRTQKLEAVGQLSGGLAHDFNNLLTIILGYGNILADQFDEGDPRRADVDQIRKAGERAAQLTRQLLAFSRKQVLQPVVLDLNESVRGITSMLSSLLGEHIQLTLACDPAACPAKVDPGQLEQVLVNLVVNARDAMPQGGRCTIETANVELDQTFSRTHLAVEPGAYVRISVADTGVGMDEATRQRIFEPFFTTKPRGKGTGLGLATVFGIVEQSGGSIWVYSEPGFGATFKIYLPAVKDSTIVHPAPAAQPVPTGHETVLVVEDEPDVRQLVQTVLARAGYTVLSVTHPTDAIRLAGDPAQRIDLLLTDVIMPDINGAALFVRLREIRPALRGLFMSGFADDVIAHHGVFASGTPFLQKPFAGADLACKVREVLDAELAAGPMAPSGGGPTRTGAR